MHETFEINKTTEQEYITGDMQGMKKTTLKQYGHVGMMTEGILPKRVNQSSATKYSTNQSCEVRGGTATASDWSDTGDRGIRIIVCLCYRLHIRDN